MRVRRGTPKERPKALTASSVDVKFSNPWDAPRRRMDWQREVWRLIGIIGEARYVVNGFGSAVSRARFYVGEVGDDGQVIGETKNRTALKVFNAARKSGILDQEELRIIGINLAAVGEGYIVGLSAVGSDGKDTWRMVSRNDIVNRGGELVIDLGDEKRVLVPGRDTLARVWRPHPDRRAEADSSLRSCRNPLRMIELLQKYIGAQIDSRLYTGGVLVWAAGTTSSGQEGTAGEDIMRQLVELGSQSARGEGTAANVFPIVVEAPSDVVGKVQYLSLASELSKTAPDLISTFMTSFARSVDVQPEEVMGMGDANHWSTWQLREETVVAQVAPLLACVCDAVQRVWCGPAFLKAGLDPDKYRVCFDTAPLTVRPQRLKDTLDLYMQSLVSAQAVLEAGAYQMGDAPSDEESVRRFIRELVFRDPQLINNRAIRELVGITEDMVPPDAFVPELTTAATPPPPPPVPDQVPQKHTLPVMPDTQGKEPKAVTASAALVGDAVTIATANAAVRRTMEIAGGRMLGPRERGQHPNVPRHELHTVIHTPVEKIPRLVDGCADHVLALASENGVRSPELFASTIGSYCALMLRDQSHHDPSRMEMFLRVDGLIGGGG